MDSSTDEPMPALNYCTQAAMRGHFAGEESYLVFIWMFQKISCVLHSKRPYQTNSSLPLLQSATAAGQLNKNLWSGACLMS